MGCLCCWALGILRGLEEVAHGWAAVASWLLCQCGPAPAQPRGGACRAGDGPGFLLTPPRPGRQACSCLARRAWLAGYGPVLLGALSPYLAPGRCLLPRPPSLGWVPSACPPQPPLGPVFDPAAGVVPESLAPDPCLSLCLGNSPLLSGRGRWHRSPRPAAAGLCWRSRLVRSFMQTPD